MNEEVRRLAQVLREVLEAQQRGERLSDARVEADSQRMNEMILAFWAMPAVSRRI